MCALPFYTLQMEFQCLFVTAEKPTLGLGVTVAAGVTNMALDALFVGALQWGLEGAAAATAGGAPAGRGGAPQPGASGGSPRSVYNADRD